MQDHYLQSLLGDREKVLTISRQHWFVLFRSIVLEVVVSLIIIGAVIILIPLLPIAWIGLGLLAIPLISFVVDFLIWYNRKYIVTNRRVMQISGIINKNIIDSSLEKVNDVKMVQSFWGRLFGFGDIEILTASELGANLFRTIGDPIHFKTAMLNAKELLENPNFNNNKNMPDIPGLIAQLEQLRHLGVLTEEEFSAKKIELLSKL